MHRKLLILLGALLLLIPAIAGAHYLSRIVRIQSFEECIEKFPVMESVPRQCRAGWKTFTESIPEEEEESEASIRVSSPKSGDIASFPLGLEGEARTFEGTVRYRLRDADGSILADGFTTAEVEEAGEFSPFSADITYSQPSGEQGTLDVFEESAMDGEVSSLVAIPLHFSDRKIDTFKVFFSNSTEDSEALHCEVVYPTQRHVPHAEGLPQLAAEELLAGPTELEEIAGFRTNINPGVELIDFQIEDGVARANFSAEMQRELGGSCRVLAIRSQIKETLKQFPEIREVVIAVEGETEEVLQP